MQHLTRRDFVAAGVAVAASAALADQPDTRPVQADATPKPAKRTLRKAIMIGMCTAGSSIEEKLRIIKDAGFEGVEGNSPDAANTDEFLNAAAKVGIVVHGMVNSSHWRIPLNAPDAKAQEAADTALKTCLLDAKRFGSTSILLVPGVVNEKLPYDECWKRSIARIRAALPVARETGVKIAIENVWNGFLLSPLEARYYLEEINDPMVGWHFDIGNVINFGWPEQWVRILGKHILKLHIKDFSRKKRDAEGLWKGFAVELGDGDAGWPRVMGALDEIGYSTDPAGRWATAEVSGGDATRLAEIAQRMDRLFA